MNPFDWSRYAVGGAASRPDSFTKLNPDYAARVAQMLQAADAELGPRALTITSAYRSPEVQARLYQQALAKYGSEKAARKWVAPPGKSRHNYGLAVDLANSQGSLLRDAKSREAQWIAQNAARFGLSVPMSWEPWQVELAGSRGKGNTMAPAMVRGGAGQASLLGQAGGDTLSPAAEPEKRRGLLGFLGDEDRRARLAIALEGMTLNPNMALVGTLQEGIKGRREDKRINATAQWLKSRGRDDLAEAMAAGGLSPTDAVRIAMTPEDPMAAINLELAQLQLEKARNPQAEPIKGVAVGGSLVNPITGEIIYQGQQGADPRSAIAKLEADRRDGLITEEQYKAALAAMAPSGISVSIGPDGQVQFTQGAAAAKPFTEGQSKDVVYATRAKGALSVLDPVAGNLTSLASRAAGYDPTGIVRGQVQSPEYQVARQAADEFLQAILRKDTGASITAQEQELYGTTYLPQPGDGKEVLQAKAAARQRAIAAIEAGMSPAQMIAAETALQSGATQAPAGGASGFATMGARELMTVDVTKLSAEELRAFMQRMSEVNK